MVIDLGSRSCGTPEDSFTDNVVYLLGGRNEGSFQSCHLLIGCGKYGSIWPAVSLYVRHACVCVRKHDATPCRQMCLVSPPSTVYRSATRAHVCSPMRVRYNVGKETGGGGRRAGLMYLG